MRNVTKECKSSYTDAELGNKCAESARHADAENKQSREQQQACCASKKEMKENRGKTVKQKCDRNWRSRSRHLQSRNEGRRNGECSYLSQATGHHNGFCTGGCARARMVRRRLSYLGSKCNNIVAKLFVQTVWTRNRECPRMQK